MITITGASDDIIQVKGAVVEEFDVYENGHLTLSDGTVLAHSYTSVWRFEVERAGSATLTIDRCTGNEDADVYTDKVTVTSPIEWVKQGIHELPGAGRNVAIEGRGLYEPPPGRVIDFRGDETDPLATAVFTCLGAASSCWETPRGAGEFQSTRAKEIGDELVAFIEKRYVLREVPQSEGGAADRRKAAAVDREAVAGVTVREVCNKFAQAYDRFGSTTEEAAELDHAVDLMAALDEELAELRAQQAELEKLREFGRQVAPVILEEFQQAIDAKEGLLPFAQATLDMDVLEKLTELAEDLDLGWEARA